MLALTIKDQIVTITTIEKNCFILQSDHDIVLLALEEEGELVYHGLHHVFDVGAVALELHDVRELEGVEESGPPADCQILAVHRV